MKKTSRRRFGKQITGALAALPIVTLAGSESVSAETIQQPSARAIQEIRTSHNTPPDVVISDGSVIIESEDELDDAGGFKYKPKTNPTANPDITHIRILVDNGDKVYEDLESKGSEVVINVQKNGSAAEPESLKIKNDSGSFTITSKKVLDKKNTPTKPRKNKLVHSDGESFRIASVKVIRPNDGLISTFEAASKFESAEFRVLIWRH